MLDDTRAEFINDILKPWEDLSERLAYPYAVQSGLSDFTRDVKALAISLSHFWEQIGKGRKDESLMNDITDTAKHKILRKPERITTVNISSCFLCNDENKFLFVRNIPFIRYREQIEYEECDFMAKSLEEMREIMHEIKLTINRPVKIKECQSKEYTGKAALQYCDKTCIQMDKTNLRFFKKRADGSLIPYDPPKVFVELL